MHLIFRVLRRSPTCHLLLLYDLQHPLMSAMCTPLHLLTVKAPIHLPTHPWIPYHRCLTLIGPLRLNIHLNMIYRHFGLQHPSVMINDLWLLCQILINLTPIHQHLHPQLGDSGLFRHQTLTLATHHAQDRIAHFVVQRLGQLDLKRTTRLMMWRLSSNRQGRTRLASSASKCGRLWCLSLSSNWPSIRQKHSVGARKAPFAYKLSTGSGNLWNHLFAHHADAWISACDKLGITITCIEKQLMNTVLVRVARKNPVILCHQTRMAINHIRAMHLRCTHWVDYSQWSGMFQLLYHLHITC